MKAPPFTYHRPTTLEEALDLLAEHGDEAKVLAGGQSLIPLMALRMARPAHLVDIAGIEGLDRITVGDDGSVTFGAMVRHEQAKASREVNDYAPLIATTMPYVAHRAIRSQGTLVGSIAHADPAAEMPAVALATGATMVARAPSGERDIAAADFFQGYLDTALEPGEILTAVRFPAWLPTSRGVTVEVARRHGDYALLGLVVALEVVGNAIASAALTFFGTASVPVRARAAEQLLSGAPIGVEVFDAAAGAAADELDLPADIHGTTAYRTHLARVLVRKGLAEATGLDRQIENEGIGASV